MTNIIKEKFIVVAIRKGEPVIFIMNYAILLKGVIMRVDNIETIAIGINNVPYNCVIITTVHSYASRI